MNLFLLSLHVDNELADGIRQITAMHPQEQITFPDRSVFSLGRR